MPSCITISTEDLDRLTPGDLEEVRWIERTDPEKWNETHMERLRELVNQRGFHHSLDAAALEQKLEDILLNPNFRRSQSRPSTHVPSHTPSPDPEYEAIKKRIDRRIENWYHELIELGGRPAYPLHLSFASPDDLGEYEDIIEYLGSARGFEKQKEYWIRFRRFQRRKRRTAETFAQYQQEMVQYRHCEGIKGNIHLHLDAAQQTKVDEWKEYHYFHHRKLPAMRVRAEESRQRREQERKEWELHNGNKKDIDITGRADIGWIFPNIAESELEGYMFFLDWIERQVPIIERECEVSHGDSLETSRTVAAPENVASTSSYTKRAAKRDRRSTGANTVLRSVRESRVAKSYKKSKPSVQDSHFSYSPAFGIPPVTVRPGGRRLRTQSRATKITENPAAQPFTKASAEPSSKMAPLRRSQRIKDLEARKSNQSEIPPRESQQRIANAVPQIRQNGRVFKGSNLSPHAKPQGIVKSQITKKRSLSRTSKQIDR